MEELFMTVIIGALEGIVPAIFDMTWVYLHYEIPKDKIILFRLRDEFVDIMLEVNPEHKKNVIYDNGQK